MNISRILFHGTSIQFIAWKNLENLLNTYFKELKHVYGALVFRKMPDHKMKFIFATDNALRFLGMGEVQYLKCIENGIEEEVFMKECRNRGVVDLDRLPMEKNTYYIDPLTGEKIVMKCVLLTADLYELAAMNDNIQFIAGAGIPKNGIFVRTFGHFDVFVNGNPVIFTSAKEKELLALLIDHCGGTLSSEKAIEILWDDDSPDEKVKARFRKLAHNLKNTLKSYGIEGILKDFNGVRCVISSAFQCDYYEYLAGNPSYSSLFHNQYMIDYEWAEKTLGSIWKNPEDRM